MIRRAIARVALAAAIVGLAACGSGDARRPNEVHLALSAEPTSLSLVGNVDNNASQIASMISDGLVGLDAKGNCVPLVARSWEIAPDGLSIVFHLRDGVLWHDGTKVTSADVAYTVRLIQNPATQARTFATDFADVVAVDTPDESTVVARYSRPYADSLFAWRAPLVPEHLASKDRDFLTGAFAQAPIGCGPFRFESHTPGQTIALRAFDDYWGGRPPLDRIVIRVLSNERTGYEALLVGQLDLMAVTPDLWRESLASSRASRLARFVYYRLNGWKIDWNMDGSNPFFTDARVRRALVMALDRSRFAANVVAGLARPAVGSYPPESPWSNAALKPLPYDPSAAAKLLDEAGWTLSGHDRMRSKDGKPFAFAMMISAGSQELTDRLAAWVQQSLAEIGVTVTIEKVEQRAFVERRKKHSFQAVMASNLFDPTADQYSIYHSSQRDGGMNYGGFSDPEVDRLVDVGRTTVDPIQRREIYDRLQERLHDEQPISYILQFASPVLHDADLLGVASSPMGLYQFVPGPRAWHWSGAGRP